MSQAQDDTNQESLAKFEQLYVQRGQPTELDEDFLQEFFEITTPVDSEAVGEPRAPHTTNAHLAERAAKKLVRVSIPNKRKALVVQTIPSCTYFIAAR